METVSLEWHGPFSLLTTVPQSLFVAPVAADPGIYVWTVPTPTGNLIQYVGETGKSFASRHREHRRGYETGMYSIHRAGSFREGRRDPVYAGYLWSKRRQAANEPVFRQQRAELGLELDGMLEAIEVFLAPLKASQRVRRRVETVIVQLLTAAGGQEAAFLDEGLSTWDRSPAEMPVLVESRCSVSLRGLPAQFEA